MKKFPAALAALFLLPCLLAGCGRTSKTATASPIELTVFAAASMTETMTTLGDRYTTEHPDITIVLNFDSSGTLKTQIQEGAVCDIFISAGQKQMDQLDASANTEGIDLILDGSRLDILENKVVLAVPDGNPANLHSYEDLILQLKSGDVLLAIGNADVPVGQYTQKLLRHFELDEDALSAAGSLTYASNAKEVTTQIREGMVDCGIIYQTDAFSAGLTVVDTASAEMCGQVIYPAAIMNTSGHPEAAQAFLDFLISDVGDEIFSSVGFSPIA